MFYKFEGVHILAEFYDIPTDILSETGIEGKLEEIVTNANATCLETSIHYFENGSYTVYSLLAESHVSIHTYIEHNAAFLDIFTCGNSDPELILDGLEIYYEPKKKRVEVVKRGLPY